MPRLSFHCVGGCWGRTQDWWIFSIGSQSDTLTTRLDLIQKFQISTEMTLGCMAFDPQTFRGRIQRKTSCVGPYDGADYEPHLTSTPESSSNTFTMGNPMPESTFTLCQSRLYPPIRDFGFGLWWLISLGNELPSPKMSQCKATVWSSGASLSSFLYLQPPQTIHNKPEFFSVV